MGKVSQQVWTSRADHPRGALRAVGGGGGAPIVKKWQTESCPRSNQARHSGKGGVNQTTLLQTRNKPGKQSPPDYPGLPWRDWPSIAEMALPSLHVKLSSPRTSPQRRCAAGHGGHGGAATDCVPHKGWLNRPMYRASRALLGTWGTGLSGETHPCRVQHFPFGHVFLIPTQTLALPSLLALTLGALAHQGQFF